MRILFLSGSLEPGKDGVGDYTRALAGECLRLGHETFLSGLNDSWIGERQRMEPAVLRLGTMMPWSDRAEALQTFLAASRAEIVSLQFVPYSFHGAGLNFALPQILGAAVGQTPVHIMFHEIWIGAYTGAPLKVRLIGFCQRKIIQAITNTLACETIHASTSVYIQLLARCGIEAKQLPLFGNVPIGKGENELQRDKDTLRLGMFGSIHPEWSPDEMFARLGSLNKSIQLSHIGRMGAGESVWRGLTQRFGSKVKFSRLGEQPLEKISRFLSSVDFGVTSTPLSLIGKSGTVASMLDHGLPVIVNRNDVHFRSISDIGPISESLIPADERFLQRLTQARRQPPRARLTEVASQFLNDIGAS